MVRAFRRRVDENVGDAGHEIAMHEGIVEQSGNRALVGGQGPAMRIGRLSPHPHKSIDRPVIAQRPPEPRRRASGQRIIFLTIRQHVEIAEQNILFRHRRIGNAIFDAAGHRTALQRVMKNPAFEKFDLGNPLVRTHMVEMQAVDPQRPARGCNHRFQRHALHIHALHGPATWQKQRARGQNGVTRQDHIAKLEASLDQSTSFIHTRIEMHVAARRKTPVVAGKERGESGRHIGEIIAVKSTRHFLKRNDIRTPEIGGNPRRIIMSIESKPELDIVADQFHDNL